ncbi:hypothetical protein DPEC_G00219160 [Dallia pectoralis]|uniref:Uncharacterized protein n=1 Tax=Dallia pectoralis TaxID=75939 RepID=A0ACC2G308_DALPE|nr:hypothetical protein DPEC_G00219160 [Dallia pectoralis]
MEPDVWGTLWEHTATLSSMGEAITSLVETLKRLGTRISDTARPAEVPRLPEEVALPSSPPGTRGMNFLRPAAYDGAAERCQGFLLQLELYFEDLSPAPSDRQKVAALITCLSGKALFWANAIWSGGGSDLRSYRTISDYFRSVFDKPPDGREVGERLALLRQGKRSVQEFALEFRTLAAGAGWNERAYIDIFRVRLNPEVRREMACKDATLSFEELVELAIKLDNLLNARGRSGPGPSFHSARLSLQSLWSWEAPRPGRPRGLGSAPFVVEKGTLPPTATGGSREPGKGGLTLL